MIPDTSFFHLLAVPMPVTLGVVNVYLIPSDDGLLLIDTGTSDDGAFHVLTQKLSALGHTVADIRRVLVTHYHPDHCGLAMRLQQAGAHIWMSRKDADVLVEYFANPQADVDRAQFFGRHPMPQKLSQRIGTMARLLRDLHAEFVPDALFDDGDMLGWGGISLEVVDTPGHTPGHVAFVSREHRVLFVGDHLLADQVAMLSAQDISPDTDALTQMFASLALMDRFVGFSGAAGHGPLIEDVAMRAQQTAGFHRARLQKVCDALLDEPQTALALSVRAFGEKRSAYSQWLSMTSAVSLLEYLHINQSAQRLTASDGSYLYRR
ncbi:MAG: MBL fold metallo-hydrolase [Myxococcales bacterium]|nr:MBL fold metallo-hydrolase [Myxococcales bacterium]